MRGLSVSSHASCVIALLLPTVLGVAISHDTRTLLNDSLSLTWSNVSDPAANTYTSDNSSALNAADPSVMTNLRRGVARINEYFPGSKVYYIDSQSRVPLGSPREQPEGLKSITISFSAGEGQSGKVYSNPSVWGNWGIPYLDPSYVPRKGALPFDIPNLRVDIPSAIASISSWKYPGNLFAYWINTSGSDTLVRYSFHVGTWLISMDAVTGKIMGVKKWPPGGNSDDLPGDDIDANGQQLPATS